jgi:hypothetical protein
MNNHETLDLTSQAWRIMIPPGWTTIPTDPTRAEAAIKRFLDDSLRGKHRDELIMARIEVETGLRDQIADARTSGARAVHVLTEPFRNVPVTASLVVSQVAVAPDDDLAEALEEVLGESDGVVEVGECEIAGLPALRRVRREADDELEERTGRVGAGARTLVDYVVFIDGATILVMAFATSTPQVANELVQLFDAMAGTLELAPA